MSSTLRWMPLDIPDYLNDTGHLTTLQHGAYMLLLMHYWRHGPLPDDDEQLAAITKTDAKTWRAIKRVIRGFFQNGHNGELHQKRADKERDKAHDISAKRRAAASDRWSGPPNGGANGHANASAKAPPNAGASAPHKVQPTGRQEQESVERKEDFLKTLNSSPGTRGGAREKPPADGLDAVLSEAGITPPEPLGNNAAAAQVRRVASALAMRIPHGEVRSAEAQTAAIQSQPQAVGAEVTMGLKWQPAETVRTPEEQATAIMAGITPEQAERARRAFAARAARAA